MRPNIKYTVDELVEQALDRAAFKIACVVTVMLIAAFIGGCYVGKAAFQGEKMQIYPLFSTSATNADCAEEE